MGNRRSIVRANLLCAAAGALVGAGTADAEFTFLKCVLFEGERWAEHGYADLTTWRLYANFDGLDPDDGVVSVLALSLHPDAGTFHNDPLGGLTAPPDLRPEIWSNQWDTYVTINATSSDGDATTTTPDFASATNELGTGWKSEDVGWFVTPDDSQSVIGPDKRVLLGQFVVASDHISGSVQLLLRNGSVVNEEFEFCCVPSGDTTGCGCVNFASLLVVLGNWGTFGPAGDADCSGHVDFQDILLVLSEWD